MTWDQQSGHLLIKAAPDATLWIGCGSFLTKPRTNRGVGTEVNASNEPKESRHESHLKGPLDTMAIHWILGQGQAPAPHVMDPQPLGKNRQRLRFKEETKREDPSSGRRG
jgi:hypothetical protein